ncbi:MAG: glycoside hydrolase family 13 protein [Clostridiales bacterium]|nr:glycoside hydrolase family 13 protein [Clostridiales bacterium]
MPDLHAIHDSRSRVYREPFGALKEGEEVTLRLYLSGADAANASVVLRIWDRTDRYLDGARYVKDGFTVFEFTAEAPAAPAIMWYNFRVTVNGELFYAGAKDGVLRSGECRLTKDVPHDFRITVVKKDFKAPEAFMGGIAYQAFPDRFAVGAYPSLSSALAYHRSMGRRITEKRWNEEVDFLPRAGEKYYSPSDYYLGNIRGIIDRIPYFKSLFVDVLYLNPIFESPYNHRYSISDYMRIDPLLGTEEDFTDLCEELKKAGIKLILDGVFSHTGDDSRYFDRRGTYGKGAFGNKTSPYREWYDFSPRYKNGFRCWWDFETLPEVNELTPSYMDFVAKVLEKWIRLGANGWRLDVADELPDEFIKFLRLRLKAIDPEAVLIGEVWEDAVLKTDCFGRRREYVNGEELDGVMDYPFMEATVDFLMGKTDANGIRAALGAQLEGYPRDFMRAQLGFLGSHDTMRILSVLSGAPEKDALPREKQAAWEPSPENAALGKKRLKQASALQFAMPFTPCIYYGDEAGLTGLSDPFCRRPYPWGEEDPELLAHYRSLTSVRAGNRAFREGLTAFAVSGRDVFAILRRLGEDETITVVNRGAARTVALTADDFHEGETDPLLRGEYLNAVTGRRASFDGRLTVTVPANGFAVLLRERGLAD